MPDRTIEKAMEAAKPCFGWWAVMLNGGQGNGWQHVHWWLPKDGAEDRARFLYSEIEKSLWQGAVALINPSGGVAAFYKPSVHKRLRLAARLRR